MKTDEEIRKEVLDEIINEQRKKYKTWKGNFDDIDERAFRRSEVNQHQEIERTIQKTRAGCYDKAFMDGRNFEKEAVAKLEGYKHAILTAKYEEHLIAEGYAKALQDVEKLFLTRPEISDETKERFVILSLDKFEELKKEAEK
jgi:predicted trehalose synthase